MAWSAPSAISTKAKPRERPVSRSEMTWAEVTVPCWPNTSRRSSAVGSKDRLPTYGFLLMVILSRPLGPRDRTKTHSHRECPGRQTQRGSHGTARHPDLPDRPRSVERCSGLRPWRTARRSSERDHQARPKCESCVDHLPVSGHLPAHLLHYTRSPAD